MNPEDWSAEKLRRKADQEWEMAGLARQDGDKVDELRHTELAREYTRLLGDRLREQKIVDSK